MSNDKTMERLSNTLQDDNIDTILLTNHRIDDIVVKES